MGSDIMFSKSSWDIFQCVGMLSVASTCMGALAFALCWNVDYLIWKHGIKRKNRLVDNTKQRKIQRLRWTYLISFYKQTKNRNETCSNLSLGSCFTVLPKRLGRKRFCGRSHLTILTNIKQPNFCSILAMKNLMKNFEIHVQALKQA